MDKAIVGVAMAALAASAQGEVIGFDADQPGTLPAGWVGGVTGTGAYRWTVEADSSAPSAPTVLRQAGVGNFPWCVKKDVALADGFVEVKFKPQSGRDDQAGGAVGRGRDGEPYCGARARP